MFDSIEIMRMAQGMAKHAGARQAVVAENIANADTPGFKSKDIVEFAKTVGDGPSGDRLKATRPGHIGMAETQAGRIVESATRAEPSPNGNSVSLEGEMVKATEARQQHDLALAIYKSSLDVLRVSLGRGR